MAQSNNQKNSFISILEQIANLNKNSVEIITKLNDVVASNKSSVKVPMTNNDGTTSYFELPTVGWLQNELLIANSNIRKLSGIEGDSSVTIIDQNNNSKKVKSIDLNREPDQISNLNITTQFNQNNNWFFDSLINPTLGVELDLTGKIADNVTKILSRRYIVQFEKDLDGNFTTNGTNSLTDFKNTFLNRNDFTMETFLTWLKNPTNYGVITTDENQYKDEQYFDLNFKEINFKGSFSILKSDSDYINNKVWYHFDTLTYYDRKGGTKTLAIGDVLAINKKNSYTKYRILEINTDASVYRVTLERIEGYDPVPIGTTKMLSFYSTLSSNPKVNVSIGFDEYNVIFVKAINTDNNIIALDWSKGMSFYSNDLVLSTDNNVNMADYYLSSVYDYGLALKDLVAKRIPSKFATKPNKPTLITDNFKVVQINKHLTDTKDFTTLKKLHSQKNSVKSKLSEISDAITQKNMDLNTKVFKSVAERSRAQNELTKYVQQQESHTKLYTSYVNQITNSVVEVSAEPKFRIRGFWDIPDPVIKTGYKPQEVIGFEIQWRYGSKLGADNTTDGFEMTRPSYSSTISSTNFTTLNQQYRKKTAYFSQWNTFKSDIRKRTYDETTGKWIWEIEDVTNADVPNINQLDISIQQAEKVDVRIRSISEVGYPETPLFSDWSEVITVEFPDELNDVLGRNEYIMREANQELMRVQFEEELVSRGIPKHSEDSFYVNEQYFGHVDKNIATSFKDTFGNTLSLFDYLKSMNDKIAALEEAIKRAKGELKVTLFKGTQETEITNGSRINVVINCEDYMIEASGSTQTNKIFKNNIYLVSDYYLLFENVATENNLGLISYKNMSHKDFKDENNNRFIPELQPGGSLNVPTFISDDGKLYQQYDNQYIWLFNNAMIDGTSTNLYDGDISSGTTNALGSNYTNLGARAYNSSSELPPQKTLIGDTNTWTNSLVSSKPFGATTHPYVVTKSNSNSLVDKNQKGIHIIDAQKSEKIPLQIFFKADMTKSDSVNFSVPIFEKPLTLKKALKFHIDEENSNKPFDFTIIFTLIRHRQYAIQQDYIISDANFNRFNSSTY